LGLFGVNLKKKKKNCTVLKMKKKWMERMVSRFVWEI